MEERFKKHVPEKDTPPKNTIPKGLPLGFSPAEEKDFDVT